MKLENRGNRVVERQFGELLAPGREELMRTDHESLCPQLDQGCKGRIDVVLLNATTDRAKELQLLTNNQ
jgi:hypothetical protein